MAAPSPAEFTLTVEDGPGRTGPQGGVRPAHGAPVRTHLPDGTVLSWRPATPDEAARCAVDAEYADQPVPAAMARRFGVADFWTRWTRAEVCAKLADTPILLWLTTYGLDADPAAGSGLLVHTLDLAGPDGRTIRVSAGTACNDTACNGTACNGTACNGTACNDTARADAPR